MKEYQSSLAFHVLVVVWSLADTPRSHSDNFHSRPSSYILPLFMLCMFLYMWNILSRLVGIYSTSWSSSESVSVCISRARKFDRNFGANQMSEQLVFHLVWNGSVHLRTCRCFGCVSLQRLHCFVSSGIISGKYSWRFFNSQSCVFCKASLHWTSQEFNPALCLKITLGMVPALLQVPDYGFFFHAALWGLLSLLRSLDLSIIHLQRLSACSSIGTPS